MASFAVVAASLRFSPSSKASSGSFGFRLGLRLEELATEAQETLRRLPSRWLRPVEAKEGVLGVFVLWSGLSGSDILKRIWGLLEISRTARSPAAGAPIAEAFLLECGRLAVGAPEPGAKRSPGEGKKDRGRDWDCPQDPGAICGLRGISRAPQRVRGHRRLGDVGDCAITSRSVEYALV